MLYRINFDTTGLAYTPFDAEFYWVTKKGKIRPIKSPKHRSHTFVRSVENTRRFLDTKDNK